ncbi:hypothetical protein AGLY_007321 [Aphis glycines]|uniref:Uncharacterized protein n=1 Tax=Aphis glycines TaxID=307491 RepID=A0A6G0TPE7_APHGL|nr:hypothetical protein AGLY_007321 [Aphis glycines]
MELVLIAGCCAKMHRIGMFYRYTEYSSVHKHWDFVVETVMKDLPRSWKYQFFTMTKAGNEELKYSQHISLHSEICLPQIINKIVSGCCNLFSCAFSSVKGENLNINNVKPPTMKPKIVPETNIHRYRLGEKIQNIRYVIYTMKTYEKQPQNNATLVPHLKTPLAIANSYSGENVFKTPCQPPTFFTSKTSVPSTSCSFLFKKYAVFEKIKLSTLN